MTLALAAWASPVRGQNASRVEGSRSAAADSVTIRIVNTELRSAVQLMGQYLDRPVVFSGASGPQVTLETPRPVPRSDVPRLLAALVQSQNYDFVDDSVGRLFRVRPRDQAGDRTIRAGALGEQSEFVSQRPVLGRQVELFGIPIQHARAVDVAATINALYGKGPAPGSEERRGPAPTLSDELRQIQVPSGAAAGAPAAGSGALLSRGATLSGEVTIVPDTRGNSLLVRSNAADFQLIQAAVKQIDVRPLQVLIEVLIAEAQRDRSFSVGVDANLPPSTFRGRGNTQIGGDYQGPGGAGLGEFVLKVMDLGGVDIDATVRVAAARGDVTILSRPVVITANNQEAHMVVGSQRPFVQVSRALPTDAAVRDQVVQYKDVGTKLTVRPTISADGLVQLEVTQEVSNATTETAFNAPVIATRSVSTNLLVRDGQTVVLGGLTDRQRDVASSGVPILSSIPLIGGLFGRHARRSTATELFIFLTPRVLRTDQDASTLSDPLRARAEKIQP